MMPSITEAMDVEGVRNFATHAQDLMKQALPYIRRPRPIYSKELGLGDYGLMSFSGTKAGLHFVVYIVVHLGSETPVGIGDTKAQALAAARNAVASPVMPLLIACCLEAQRQRAVQAQQQARVEPSQSVEPSPRPTRKVSQIGRRRRSIFAESNGMCHYCGCHLELEGKWHVEHKFPRALGGTDERTNLVASCVPCNMKKRDRTDIEFAESKARR